jgi:hypothetical protein
MDLAIQIGMEPQIFLGVFGGFINILFHLSMVLKSNGIGYCTHLAIHYPRGALALECLFG